MIRRITLISVPLNKNNGRPQNPADLTKFESGLIAIYGGFTKLPNGIGAWFCPPEEREGVTCNNLGECREVTTCYFCHGDDDLTPEIIALFDMYFPDQKVPGIFVTGPFVDEFGESK